MPSIEIPPGTLEEWLDVLKPYQRSTILEFLKDASPEQAAERWLGATGSSNIVPFGGVRDSKPFWDRFRIEFTRFVCDDDAYLPDRQALTGEGPVTKALLVGEISAVVGAEIGLAPSLLAPAVVLLLFSVAKMGRNAYCAGQECQGPPPDSMAPDAQRSDEVAQGDQA